MSQTDAEQSIEVDVADSAAVDATAVALAPASAKPDESNATGGTFSDLPGRVLREAREARGLTLADVAQALKFGVRQIEALEADNYEGLQGATFVRGFIRSYARFLKLAPEPLLAMLEAGSALRTSEVRPPDDTGAAMPQPGVHRLSAWVASAIVLVVIAVSLIVWHFISPESIPSFPGDLTGSKTEAPAAQAVAPPLLTPVAPPESKADAGNVSQLAAPVATVLPPDGRQLLLTFSDKSWVEIKDASQRVVLSGEFRNGDRQVANGKPPFQIWVGRASAVRIIDGDREIDLKPHARDEVARLTVE